MKASVSLWSADLMEVGTTGDRLTGVADGFHVAVVDGQFAPSLLFGPDFVRALRGRTDAVLDVHLVVAEADRWVETFAEAGADVLTLYPKSSSDLSATLEAIRALGTSPGVSVNLDYPMGPVREFADLMDRVLIMGTESGIKGAGLDRRALERVGEVRQRQGPEGRPEIYVDRGIRRHTVPEIALPALTALSRVLSFSTKRVGRKQCGGRIRSRTYVRRGMLERVHDGRVKDVRGVDLGGTYLRRALADEEGEIRPTRQDSALAHEGCDAVLGGTIVLLEESRGQTAGGVAAVEAPPSTER